MSIAEFSVLFYHSGRSVLTVLLIAAGGVFLARTGALKLESTRAISTCVFSLMLPCLLFSKLATAISLERLQELWILPVSCVALTALGFAVGMVGARLAGHGRDDVGRVVITCAAIPNASYLPIPLMLAACSTIPALAAIPGSGDIAVAYISIYLVLFSPMMWTLGFAFLSGEKGGFSMKGFFSPPLAGVALGLLVGLAPPLKALLVQKTGVLYPFYNAADTIGIGTIPAALIVLGSNLYLARSSISSGHPRAVIAAVACKLAIFPLLTILYVYILIKFGVIRHDPVMAVMLVVTCASPTAVSVAVMCNVLKKCEEFTAGVLFWNYLLAAPALTFFIMAALLLFAQ